MLISLIENPCSVWLPNLICLNQNWADLEPPNQLGKKAKTLISFPMFFKAFLPFTRRGGEEKEPPADWDCADQ